MELFALRKRKGEVAAVRKERQVQVNELQQESLAHKTECEEVCMTTILFFSNNFSFHFLVRPVKEKTRAAGELII